MTVISTHEKKRLERKLDLFCTLYETAGKGEREPLLRDIVAIEQKLGIKSKREVRTVKEKHLPFTKEELLESLNKGLTQAKVAEKYNLSEGYISRIKKAHFGVEYRVAKRPNKLTPDDLARLLNEGYSIPDIADMYKMTTRGVGMIKAKYIEKQFYLKEG